VIYIVAVVVYIGGATEQYDIPFYGTLEECHERSIYIAQMTIAPVLEPGWLIVGIGCKQGDPV
jgi:hypothetical protein